jgi:hypothetical protein
MPRPLALVLLLCPLAALAAGAPTNGAVALKEVDARIVPVSADGRYQVHAEVRLADAAKSIDGRYQLKSTTASCEPFPEQLFRNGFEPGL